MNNVGLTKIGDKVKNKLLEEALKNKSEFTRHIYFGQVISNSDSKNANRIKVRIPIIDDIFYQNDSKETGDKKLPWCLPTSQRFIDTPENNQIVIVELFDIKTPYFGRLYYDSITDMSSKDLFDKLSPEEQSLSNWLNASQTIDSKTASPKNQDQFNVKNNINYKVGIRGKGKNKILLGQDKIEIVQNQKDREKESSLTVTKDLIVDIADVIKIKSKKGKRSEYHPVFSSILFDYLSKQMEFNKKVIKLLNSVPAISPIGPCTASPKAVQLLTELQNLNLKLKELKKTGYSEKIYIN